MVRWPLLKYRTFNIPFTRLNSFIDKYFFGVLCLLIFIIFFIFIKSYRIILVKCKIISHILVLCHHDFISIFEIHGHQVYIFRMWLLHEHIVIFVVREWHTLNVTRLICGSMPLRRPVRRYSVHVGVSPVLTVI